MKNFKVFQGTRSVDAPRLCDSCSNGVVLRGPADSEEYVYCSLVEKPIGIRVTECNRYTDRTHAPLWAMKAADERGRKCGPGPYRVIGMVKQETEGAGRTRPQIYPHPIL